LLTKYTKIVAINGSNGSLFWNSSLLGFPYKFYRQYEYIGSYENPLSGNSRGNNFYNRINGKIPSGWGNFDNTPWEISTLLHPNNIKLLNGTSSANIFDLWGIQDTNFTITSSNSSESSESLKVGTTQNSTSTGTVASGDNSYWILNSVNFNGEHKIIAELSFNLSQQIESELQYMSIDYEGFVLDDTIDRFDISIYNFSNGGYWNKISSNIINDADSVKMVKSIHNLNGLTFGNEKLVKIKLEAKNTSAFTLFLDKLIVNYTYTHGNYTIRAEWDETSWNSLIELTIPVDFSEDNLLGVMEYPLSQIERFSALKFQSQLTVNTTETNEYRFSYELYDASNSKWVLCNWSKTTKTWNNYSYADLKGGFSNNRDNYKNFSFSTNSYKYDYMWLKTRGVYDEAPYLEFDYENKTTLSNFIDSNKNIRIRLNITNNNAFNLTIDHFGIGAFYWGLFSSQFDRYYIWEYDVWPGEELTTENLLNLEVQDFEVINGTNDKYLDIVALIGIEGIDYWGGSSEEKWSTRIRLFDIKNKEVYTKWSLNATYIPYQNARIVPINNSLNCMVLSGIFQFGNNYNCSHKLIGDPHWESQISHFENYTESKIKIDFIWEEIPEFPIEEYYYYSSYPYEFPGKTTISKDGKIGIIIGEYEISEEMGDLILSNIRIIDVNNLSPVSKISARYLESLSYSSIQEAGSIDFNSNGAGYRLLISYEDFNDDEFLDHVGFYSPEMMSGEYLSGTELRIYSGNSGEADSIVLTRNFFEDTIFSYNLKESSSRFTMPFISIDDINNDEIPEGLMGVQSSSDICKGSYLSFYDIYNSNENELNELTEYKWELDPVKCLSRYATIYYEFIFDINKIGDINADNVSEVCVLRNNFIETRGEYGYRTYEMIPITEILDVYNQNTLYRFKMEVDSLHPFVDLNEDNNKELFISSDEVLYCINSKFGIQILNPKNGKSIGSHSFNIRWDTDSDYDYFEVIIDGVSQGSTINKKVHVSLGSGWRQISIIMYDKSGLINAISTIRVLVPSNQTHLILTFIFLGVAAGLLLVYRRYRKKQEELILIDKKVKEGGKKR